MFTYQDTSSSLVTLTDSDVFKQRRQYSRAPTNDGTMIDVGNMTPLRLRSKQKNYIRKLMVSGHACIVERLLAKTTSDSMWRLIWMGCATLAIFATKISGLKAIWVNTSSKFTQNQINVIQYFRNKKLMHTHISSSHKQRLSE